MEAKNPNLEKEDVNPYFELRKQVLELDSNAFTNYLSEHPVYAAIVDMDMGSAVATLVCVADGTTSLYFSNGGGKLGLGQDHEAVKTATLTFLGSVEQILDQFAATEEYPLPTGLKHTVYLVTEKGVLAKSLDPLKADSYPKEMHFLNYLYQNVLMKIGEAA